MPLSFTPVPRYQEKEDFTVSGSLHQHLPRLDYKLLEAQIMSFSSPVPSPVPDTESVHDNYWWVDYPCSSIGNRIRLT